MVKGAGAELSIEIGRQTMDHRQWTIGNEQHTNCLTIIVRTLNNSPFHYSLFTTRYSQPNE